MDGIVLVFDGGVKVVLFVFVVFDMLKCVEDGWIVVIVDCFGFYVV